MAPAINGAVNQVPNPDHQLWFQTDQVVQSWLLGSVFDQLQSVVLHCSSAQEIWYTLDRHFNRPSNSRLVELQQKIQTASKTNKTIVVTLSQGSLWSRKPKALDQVNLGWDGVHGPKEDFLSKKNSDGSVILRFGRVGSGNGRVDGRRGEERTREYQK